MRPGRELDRAVAEKVMGWKREMRRPTVGPEESVWIAGDRLYWDRHDSLPAFSTSIADAWQVVDKLLSQDHIFQLKKQGVDWQAEFAPHFAYAETASNAICLAALQALTHNP